jgi:hypothetical protein
MSVMTEIWGFLQLSGGVDNGRILYKDLIICREAAYLNQAFTADRKKPRPLKSNVRLPIIEDL